MTDTNIMSEDRQERSRERNREHAKQTRLRKKYYLDTLKSRLVQLQDEAIKLQQLMDENNTANILLCLSESNRVKEESVTPSPSTNTSSTTATTNVSSAFQPIKGDIMDQLKHSVRLEAADKRKILYSDVDDQLPPMKLQRRNSDLTESDYDDTIQDEKLRRERNRIHAKLTRDRKKLFTAKIVQMISILEKQNKEMYQRLSKSDSGSPYTTDEGRGSPFPSENSPSETWSEHSHNMQSI